VSKPQRVEPRIHRVIIVTKASAAKSQLETAIQLWFDDADPVSIHTLAVAAHDCYNLSKAGWSWGCISAIDSNGQTIFVVDAHCGDGKRFVARADDKLTAFLELERVTRESLGFQNAE